MDMHVHLQFNGVRELLVAFFASVDLLLRMRPSHVTIVGSVRRESLPAKFALKRKESF